MSDAPRFFCDVHIARKPDSDKYRIVGKGITVEFLVQFINDPDWTIERICQNYDLTPAEVHSAWAFYYDHQAEIDARLAAVKAEDTLHHDESRRQRERLTKRHS
ncbi:MAG: DUF433 domain-containing protein [Anaerolineaceae bacterium]|nr:DUF433 domain-containing protein [Anaerolineaceae bacterium]